MEMCELMELYMHFRVEFGYFLQLHSCYDDPEYANIDLRLGIYVIKSLRKNYLGQHETNPKESTKREGVKTIQESRAGEEETFIMCFSKITNE
jgi:hypothetical protein